MDKPLEISSLTQIHPNMEPSRIADTSPGTPTDPQESTTEQQQYLQAILQATPDGFWVVDTQNRIIEVNDAFCKMTGYSREEILHMEVTDLDAQDSPEDTTSRMQRVVANGYDLFETRHRRKDGSILDVEVSVTFLPVQTGRIICFSRDVTERKRTERALSHSHDMMRYIIEHTTSCVSVFDLDRRYVFVSKRFLEVFRLEGQTVIGRYHYELFPHLPQRLRDVHSRALQGEVSREANDQYIHADGTEERMRWECRPWYGVDDSIQGFIVYLEVITEQVKRESALRDALQHAQAATAAKGQFLANMSHEIRTPMNGVIGCTQLLSLTELDQDQQPLVEMLEESGKRMMTIVDDILDFSRIEAGKVSVNPEPIDIRNMVESVVVPFMSMASQKGLEFNFKIDPMVPPKLIGDPTRIGQILTNLTNNAIKFTDQGSVGLSCDLMRLAEDKATLRFKVVDTGIGMSQQVLEKIFDAFFQAEESNTRKYGGAGLGLAISKQLAEMLGGSLEISSTENLGTRCLLTLPLETMEELPKTAPTPVDQPPEISPSKHRILIVEDDPHSQAIARIFLKRLGLHSGTASNGKEALHKLSRSHYDLILMDCRMPEMNGFELTRAIRDGEAGDTPTDIPIIALTAYAMRADADRCIEAGMSDYLAKPIQMDTLSVVLKKWLQQAAL